MRSDLLNLRLSGVLCHPTSLPGDFGIGDLGPNAYKFIDFLSATKQSLWQLLPFGPTVEGDFHSPYGTSSAFAGNPLLISPERLWKQGLVRRRSVTDLREMFRNASVKKRVPFRRLAVRKEALLQEAFNGSFHGGVAHEVELFRAENPWVNDYAVFMALRKTIDRPREQWDRELRCKGHGVQQRVRDLREQINFEIFCQYIFFQQWRDLKEYANGKNIFLIGDMPIYVSDDSADVWAHGEYFDLDPKTKRARRVSGVPPDRFNSSGQRWGHPVYDWKALERDSFSWWVKRLGTTLANVDLIRIDHFRGFCEYWAVPRSAKTAEFGKWCGCPGERLFDALKKKLGSLPIIIEDLGIITPDVVALKDRYNLMGMKILQFGFDDPNLRESPYVPFNFQENYVVSTGTHDNPTSREWFNALASDQKKRLIEYLGAPARKDVVREFIRMAMSSAARYCITPVQDLIDLGKEGRMNFPGTQSWNNWSWRMKEIPSASGSYLSKFTELYQRTDLHR